MYSVHLYTVHCTLYDVQCTVYIVHFTMYNVHCTLYSVHCTYERVVLVTFLVPFIEKCQLSWNNYN